MLAALQSGALLAGSLSGRELALIAYAERLTLTPASITEVDIARLREAGFDDLGIHDACAVVSYFAFVNRIADGLGVELESSGGAGGAATSPDGPRESG